MKMQSVKFNQKKLHRLLTSRFNENELRTLCLYLKVDYEDLAGEGKTDKARELVAFLNRHDRLNDLFSEGSNLRPDIGWQNILESDLSKETHADNTFDVSKSTSNSDKHKVAKLEYFMAKRRILAIGAMVLLLIGIIGIVIFYQRRYAQQSDFASDFTPAKLVIASSNASATHYIAHDLALPDSLDWYKLESATLMPTTFTKVDYSAVNSYFYLSSNLHTEHSWIGVFFWRFFPLPKLDASDKSNFIAIIHSDKADTLETTFKDAHGNEIKLHLPVVEGWAGYVIPLADFSRVDFKKIELFLLAHSKGVGSIDENVFRIALLGLR